MYKACLQLDWSDKPGEAITKRVLNSISNLSFRPQGEILKIQKVVYTKFHIMSGFENSHRINSVVDELP